MANMKDVAQRAGVSISTVSHVINETRFVSDELRERVLRAMRVLDYQPNVVARSLRTKRTQMVALVIPDITNPYFPEVARGVQDMAEQHDYSVILCNTDRMLSREVRFLKTLRRQRVDGLILNPSGVTSTNLRELQEAQIPVLLIGSQIDHPEFDVVMVDNVKGAWHAVKHLIDLGHRRIGLVGGSRATSSGEQRFQGYIQALTDHGLPIDEDLITEGPFTHEGGHECMKQLLSLPSLPTAAFASSDVMAIGALMAVQEASLQVPGDLSLVGFDDIIVASITTPKLTTVAQPKYQTGEMAARLLFNRIESASPPQRQKVVLDHELVVRGSTAPPR
jgi:LacI family transcriptional regulator